MAGAALVGAGVRHARHVDPQLRQAAGPGLNMMALTFWKESLTFKIVEVRGDIMLSPASLNLDGPGISYNF